MKRFLAILLTTVPLSAADFLPLIVNSDLTLPTWGTNFFTANSSLIPAPGGSVSIATNAGTGWGTTLQSPRIVGGTNESPTFELAAFYDDTTFADLHANEILATDAGKVVITLAKTGSGDVVMSSGPTITNQVAMNIELGHASDTTLTRSSAGVLAVEGVVIPNRDQTHPTTTALTYSGTNVTLTASSRATYNSTLTLTNNCLLTITTTDGANGVIALKPDSSTSYTVYLDTGIRMNGVAAGGSFVVTNSATETTVIAWQAILRGASAFTAATKATYP